MWKVEVFSKGESEHGTDVVQHVTGADDVAC